MKNEYIDHVIGDIFVGVALINSAPSSIPVDFIATLDIIRNSHVTDNATITDEWIALSPEMVYKIN